MRRLLEFVLSRRRTRTAALAAKVADLDARADAIIEARKAAALAQYRDADKYVGRKG